MKLLSVFLSVGLRFRCTQHESCVFVVPYIKISRVQCLIRQVARPSNGQRGRILLLKVLKTLANGRSCNEDPNCHHTLARKAPPAAGCSSHGICIVTTMCSLMALPAELHDSLLSCLPYPDQLALKHTCKYFHLFIVSTNGAVGVQSRVAWLVERYEKGLPCPVHDCVMSTDETFCSSGRWQVSRMMEVRRRHGDCRRMAGGCEVLPGTTCGGPRRANLRVIW